MTGVTGFGWLIGLVCASGALLAVRQGLVHYRHSPGPADVVTMVRVALACVVAAIVGDSLVSEPAVTALVLVSTVALALDAVDGRVARATGTTSPFGARFDGEADAFLMLVLSVYVAGVAGLWVLAIGSARYVFGAAGLVLPWMRAQLPPRYWRKVVTAVQGIVLTVAAAEVAPAVAVDLALLGALALLAESFGRDVLWLHRRRTAAVLTPALAMEQP